MSISVALFGLTKIAAKSAKWLNGKRDALQLARFCSYLVCTQGCWTVLLSFCFPWLTKSHNRVQYRVDYGIGNYAVSASSGMSMAIVRQHTRTLGISVRKILLGSTISEGLLDAFNSQRYQSSCWCPFLLSNCLKEIFGLLIHSGFSLYRFPYTTIMKLVRY